MPAISKSKTKKTPNDTSVKTKNNSNMQTKKNIEMLKKKPITNSKNNAKKTVVTSKPTKTNSTSDSESSVKNESSIKIIKPPHIVEHLKIPTITTKKSIPYTPQYKSILDSETNDHVDNDTIDSPSFKLGYSDQELLEFQELILRKLDDTKGELAYIQNILSHQEKNSDADNNSRTLSNDDSNVTLESEQLRYWANRHVAFINNLEKALIRIENKTYGICRVTGKLIDKARLRAVPHATLSIEAKEGLSNADNQQTSD
ncbi:MAG: TraR/DksA C4-type zinc finger protein [Phycisphaerales bacterium]|nr:TraR/DksA C4-type zinc finger protein [Phycisphaerales bacterium]